MIFNSFAHLSMYSFKYHKAATVVSCGFSESNSRQNKEINSKQVFLFGLRTSELSTQNKEVSSSWMQNQESNIRNKLLSYESLNYTSMYWVCKDKIINDNNA